jgi:hypothetical protein
VDELCKKAYGRLAAFDGVDACRCPPRHALSPIGHCAPAPAAPAAPASARTPAAAAASGRGGPGAAAAAAAGGRAGKGRGGGAGEYDALCQQQFGEFAEFDGVDSCR